MNAEQKKRIAHEISNWRGYDLQESETATESELAGMCSKMAALLQELVDAPEPEPVAWMVKNGFVCSMIYQSKKDADNYAADQQKRHDLSGSLASFCVIPLYTAPPAPTPEPFGYFKAEPFGWTDCAETDDGAIALFAAPPAPSVPDVANTFKRRAEEIVAMAMNRDNYAETNRLSAALIMDIANAAEATTPAEAPADVARDAARWRMLPAFLEEFEISYLRLEDAIDAAIAAEKGGA